jgi:phage host-nuclease inhibitor protein Gam
MSKAANSNRLRSDQLIPQIEDWGHADDLVRRIGDARDDIARLEFGAREEIDAIKARLAEQVKPLQERIDLWLPALEQFALRHRADFGKLKSRPLNHGTLGWQASTIVSIKKTTLDLIKKLFTPAQQKACINIKESVNKNNLRRLTDEQLKSIAARREDQDVFYVEPNSVAAASHGDPS